MRPCCSGWNPELPLRCVSRVTLILWSMSVYQACIRAGKVPDIREESSRLPLTASMSHPEYREGQPIPLSGIP